MHADRALLYAARLGALDAALRLLKRGGGFEAEVDFLEVGCADQRFLLRHHNARNLHPLFDGDGIVIRHG